MWPAIANERERRARVRAGRPRVPKKEVAINPINPRGELACSLFFKTKIEYNSLNSRPFEIALSGIDRV